jgi:hypothetical protein
VKLVGGKGKPACLPSFQMVFHQRSKITTVAKFHAQVDLIVTFDDVKKTTH